jgi:hypothetical protein
MTTEWLALWVHFLWSGALTMVCCVTVWWKVGLVAGATKGTTHTRKNESTALRRRLLNIAGMISVCLILNVIAALSTSAKLEEWSRTADMSLTCEIKETWNLRSWGVYGLDDGTVVEVCSAQDAVSTSSKKACADSCTWYPGVTVAWLVCATLNADGTVETLEQVDAFGAHACDCPCSSFVEIQKSR